MAEKGCFASDLCTLLESGAGADVTLVVGESELPAHSVILAARSPVFAAMLRSDMQEASSRRVHISDAGEAAVRQMLWFVYTDTVPELESVAAELLALADKYNLPLLKHRCARQLERDLSVESAAASAALAVLHRCPGLASAAVEFIAAHPDVLASEGWARMMQDSAAAAAEVCSQLAAALRLQAAPPNTAPEKPDTRIVSRASKQKTDRLIQAASNGWVREVWALLAAGADKDARDSSGNTALHLAASKGHTSTVKCLLDGGLDVNAADSCGQTPLHVATRAGNTEIMWTLVAASARLDAQDNQGQTPLHVAARRESYCTKCSYFKCYSHPKVQPPGPDPAVNVLLLAGASKEVKNSRGETPETLATECTKSAFNVHNYL